MHQKLSKSVDVQHSYSRLKSGVFFMRHNKNATNFLGTV